MDEWDQEKLESVVKQKHGAEKPSNQTEIICKFFLEAVEKKQYGWCAGPCCQSARLKHRHSFLA